MKEILQDIKTRVIGNWKSTLLGAGSLMIVLLIHYRVITMTEFLELIGCYHAIRLAFKKETEDAA